MTAESTESEGLAETGHQHIETTHTDPVQLGRRLEGWLSERLDADVRVDGAHRPDHGGMSSVSVLFDATWQRRGERHEEQLVARLAPEPTAVPLFPGYDLQREHDVMTAVRRHSRVAVPRVHWIEPSEQVLGAPFLVMDRVTGLVPADNPPYVFDGWAGCTASPPRTVVTSRTPAWTCSPTSMRSPSP